MKKKYYQPETAYVTKDSVVVLIFTHFYIVEVIVKYPFSERMLAEIIRETADMTFCNVSTNSSNLYIL